ncbi:hypothetical protein M422DRAFT_256834 [Sphaerobolus stellatus SS14]|uniref:Uncharacterized protein n=1 Tax=Sphaerobolus stellatus (strain SS14) TaxID=990650 RepID=A0A0C9UAV6_SPHS4|nr:hypothetical protein M422DRAFT_256834 [Sphaerobolus stellatus SS14]
MLAFTLFSSLLVASQVAASPSSSAPSALLFILRRQSPGMGFPPIPDDSNMTPASSAQPMHSPIQPHFKHQCMHLTPNLPHRININRSIHPQLCFSNTTMPEEFMACSCTTAYGQTLLACEQCAVDRPDVTDDLKTSEEKLVRGLNLLCSMNGHLFNPPLALTGSSGSSSNSSSSSTTTGTGSTGTTGSGASTSSSSTGTSTGTTSSSSTGTGTSTTSAPTTKTTSNGALAGVSLNGLVIAGIAFGVMILSLSGSY